MSPSGTFCCQEGSEALRVGVVARPQGALAHGALFPVGSECSLPIGLRGEGVEMGTHLWTEGRVVNGVSGLGARPGRSPPPASPLSAPASTRSDNKNGFEGESSEE